MSFFDQAFAPGGGVAGLTQGGMNPQMIARILAMQSGAQGLPQPGGLGALMGGAGPPAMAGQAASAGAPTMPQPPAARSGAMPQPGMPTPQVTPPPPVPAAGGQQSPLASLQAMMAMNPQLKALLQGGGAGQPGAFGSNISMPQIMSAWNQMSGGMPGGKGPSMYGSGGGTGAL